MVDTVQGHEAIGGATQRGKADTSVKTPPGVKAAADRANALVEQSKLAKAASVAAGGDKTVGETLKPPETKPRVNSVVTANFDPQNPNPPTEVNTTTNTQGVSQETSQEPQAQTPEEWEHRFKSLQGRYEKDSEEKKRLQQQLIDTQRLMAQVGPPPPQGNNSELRFDTRPPPPGRRVTQKEVAEYGEDLMDVMGRRAAEVYEPILSQLANELNQVKRQVSGVRGTVAFDAQVKMYDDLAREVPQWEQVNVSPQFGQWLDQVDPISGRRRRDFLDAAHNSNQTGQVVSIFRSFLSAAGAPPQSTHTGNGSDNGAGSGYDGAPKFDLAQFAAPGRAKAGQTTAPPEKPTFTRQAIKAFYQDKTQGKYAGREAEADALEKALFDASNEGRIR